MKLAIISPVKSLSKAYLKQSLKREQIELFKASLARRFERISSLTGGALAMQTSYIEQLPILPATDAQQTPIIERVQKILAAPASPDVPQLEAEIDSLVYELYGLTEEEIALVEGKK